MSHNNLDVRARDAARAARESVVPVEQAVFGRGKLSWEPSAVLGRRRTRNGLAGLVGVAVLLTVGVAIVAANRGSDPRSVATGPAAQGPVHGQPVPSGKPPHSSGTVLATGTSRDGNGWTLSLDGPANGLCLSVEIAGESRITPMACGGRRDDASPEAHYRPHLMDDTRAPAMVFGRMPSEVDEVEVASFTGAAVSRAGVIQAPGGPFYVAELPPGTTPDLVIGHKSDGTSVRYSTFCQEAPRPDTEMPESYVGSPQHLADLEALIPSAPPGVRDDLLRFHDYVKASVSPRQPDSQLTDKWPQEIRSAAERIERFIRDNCP